MENNTEELIKHFNSLGYFERRLAIARVFKPKLKRFLYKYKSIHPDNEQSKKELRDLLVESRLWLSSPTDFNDPFDMAAHIIVDTDARKRRKHFSTFLTNEGVPYAKREQLVKNAMRKPFHTFKEDMKRIYQKHINKVGVFSFSSDPKNILMWSHYAQEHTGICIQFELAKDFSMLCQALPVKYRYDYPIVTWPNNFADNISKAVLQKHKGWEYEQEHRIVRPKEANTYLRFKPQTILRIIIGCDTDADYKEILTSVLEERRCAKLPPVQLLYARRHETKYQLSVMKESKSG